MRGLGSLPTSPPTSAFQSEMASPERKMQFGGWTKRDWRELRPRLKKEVKKLFANETIMADETPSEGIPTTGEPVAA